MVHHPISENICDKGEEECGRDAVVGIGAINEKRVEHGREPNRRLDKINLRGKWPIKSSVINPTTLVLGQRR